VTHNKYSKHTCFTMLPFCELIYYNAAAAADDDDDNNYPYW